MHTSTAPPPPIEALPAVVFTFEPAPPGGGAFTFGAEGIARLTGVDTGDLGRDIGPLLDRATAADVAAFHASREAAARTGGRWTTILRLGARAVEWQANPVTEGGRTRWHGFATDVTDRVAAQDRARMLEAAIDQSPSAVYLVGDDLRFRYVNATACRMLGYTREELCRLGPSDIDPGATPTDLADIDRRRRSGEAFSFESLHHARDGRTLPVEVTVTPILDGEERLGLCIARDLTERTRMIGELRRREQAFRSLAEGSPASIVRYDRDGAVRYLNARGAAELGVTPEEVVGRRPGAVWPDGRFEGIEAAVRAAVEEGASGVVESWGTLPDGRPRFHQVHVVPERDASGVVIGALAYGLDATASRLHSLFLRSLLDTLPDAVWLKDRQGRYQACNRRFSQIVGLQEAELLDRTDAELGVSGDAAARAHADALALGRDGPTVTEEWVSFRADGHQELLEVARTVIRDGVGEPTGVLAIGRDVTARRILEAQLRTTASVFEVAREGIVITNPDGTILEVNAAFSRITGYSRDAVLGKNPSVLSSGLHDRAFYERIWTALRSQGAWSGELVNRRPDGGLYTEHLDIVAVTEPGGQLKHYVGVFSDITVLKQHEQHLEHMAHHDALTGLPNRFLLADRLDRAIADARRSGGMLAVLYLDLDGFKPVNDLHGHLVGDRVLVHVAERISSAVRAEDTVARLGGDEFVCILADISGADECEQVARRLLDCVDQPIHLDGPLIHLSASIGISLFPNGDGDDADLLLRHADQAMYRAKGGGRNRYVFHRREPSPGPGGSRRGADRR